MGREKGVERQGRTTQLSLKEKMCCRLSGLNTCCFPEGPYCKKNTVINQTLFRLKFREKDLFDTVPFLARMRASPSQSIGFLDAVTAYEKR